MNARAVLLVMVALAVLLARTAGLHFHVADPDAGHDHVHGTIPSGDVHLGLEDDHLLDHMAGAADVDASAAPQSFSKFMPALLVATLVGVLFLLIPPAERRVSSHPAPFRPPRPRPRAELLPPSQGPPRAA